MAPTVLFLMASCSSPSANLAVKSTNSGTPASKRRAEERGEERNGVRTNVTKVGTDVQQHHTTHLQCQHTHDPSLPLQCASRLHAHCSTPMAAHIGVVVSKLYPRLHNSMGYLAIISAVCTHTQVDLVGVCILWKRQWGVKSVRPGCVLCHPSSLPSFSTPPSSVLPCTYRVVGQRQAKDGVSWAHWHRIPGGSAQCTHATAALCSPSHSQRCS